MLDVQTVSVRYGRDTAVERVDLQIPDRGVMSLLGPSGCGKSTLLRAIAGLEPIASGRILLDGQDLLGVPVHRRGFGLMFQSGVLFPHLSVAGNIGYGLRRETRRNGKGWQRNRVAELLELVGMTDFGARAVTTLSGGQAQRVALARALAPSPRLLLLDEPLAALDAELRERLVQTLREVLTLTGTTAVYVTHDQREAFAVADSIALMRDGVIRQVGAPAAVWSAPASEWVAGFVGFSTVIERARLSGFGLVGLPESALVALRPAAFVLDQHGDVHGICTAVMPGPELTRLRVQIAGVGEVEALDDGSGGVAIGQQIKVRFDPAGAAAIG